MDRDMLFAFAHGIRLTLESLGLPFDGDVMQPVLQRMDALTSNSKHSLIKGDDSVTDWDQFRHLRAIEYQLCVEYLKGVREHGQEITEEEAQDLEPADPHDEVNFDIPDKLAEEETNNQRALQLRTEARADAAWTHIAKDKEQLEAIMKRGFQDESDIGLVKQSLHLILIEIAYRQAKMST